LSEIIGQEHITDTLSRALEKGMVSHAYLLTGPRGVGKTSIARILAYELNKLPYDDEGNHLDIIEIDAASNRRIDEIRELNERIHIAPTSAKYKVYIIDEVHMLTKEAFNALLKTLEEPPAHAIFILATTEAHKVPETIVSRTQRYTFKPVDLGKVADHLRQIAKSEDIDVDDEALDLIAAHGEGSFRDSISLLDQVRHSSDSVTLSDVQRAVGQAPSELIDNLLAALKASDMQAVASSLLELHDHGVQAPQVAKQLSRSLRQSILGGTSVLPAGETVVLLNKLLTIPGSSDPGLALELALLGSVLDATPSQQTTNSNKEPETPKTKPNKPDKTATKPKAEQITTIEAPKPANPVVTTTDTDDPWTLVLAAVKAKHNTLYGIARMAVPNFSNEKVVLSFAFPFHQKRLQDSKNKQLLMEIMTEVIGKPVELEILLDPSVKTTPVAPVSSVKIETNEDLENISNIFGGAEIVN
jgi:DNA polymerase-3 subunit gamma/tau